MSWDEGKPMPSSAEGKKTEIRKMMGAKSAKNSHEDVEESSLEPKSQADLEGVFSHARIERAGNGYTMTIEHRLNEDRKQSQQLGDETALPPTDPSRGKIKEYKTVHLKPEHVIEHLSRHLIHGQVGDGM